MRRNPAKNTHSLPLYQLSIRQLECAMERTSLFACFVSERKKSKPSGIDAHEPEQCWQAPHHPFTITSSLGSGPQLMPPSTLDPGPGPSPGGPPEALVRSELFPASSEESKGTKW
jgi:hypothetical protein